MSEQLMLIPLSNLAESYQTSSVGDFHARTSVWRERKWGFQGTDPGCFLKSSDWLAKLDPVTSYLKTSQRCLAPINGEIWEQFSGRWPRLGMMRSGNVYQHLRSGQRTNAIGSGLLPTPTAQAAKHSPSNGKHTLEQGRQINIAHAVGLHYAIPSSGLLPTPTSSDATSGAVIGKNDTFRVIKNGSLLKINQKGAEVGITLGRFVRLPTPRARDWKGTSGKNRHSPTMPDIVDGRLSPMFVERMMGFPVGWTDLGIQNGQLGEPELLTHEHLHEALQHSTCEKLPRHKHRIMELGNAIVPQVAAIGFKRILELEGKP